MMPCPECRHLLPTGRKCHALAMRHSAYCHHHDRLHRYPLRRRVAQRLEELPVSTPQEIQVALTRICNAMLSRQIEARRGGKLLYSVQLALSPLEEDRKAIALAAKLRKDQERERLRKISRGKTDPS